MAGLSRDGWTVVDDQPQWCWMKRSVTGSGHVPVPKASVKISICWLMVMTKAALADEIFGRQPLIPRYALGYWYSRYWAYTDKEIESLVKQFDQYDVPIDVMVIDMDWHKIGWTGTSWCRDYLDPAATLQGCNNAG